MRELPNAERSPRIENGVIKFYEGDTFEIGLALDLRERGYDVTLRPEDTVETVFYDCRKRPVKSFRETGIENGEVTLRFDEATTKVFPAGEYTYTMRLFGERVITLAKDNELIVE